MKKYKGKGGYSAEGLEQRVTYIIRNMFMNYRVKQIAKTNRLSSCEIGPIKKLPSTR